MPASPYRTVIESMFRVVDKTGTTTDFKLNDVQSRLDAGWSRRNIIPKARQEGVSSYVIARFCAKCLGMQNRSCVLISHEAEATRRLFGRADFILKNLKLPGGMEPKFKRHSQNGIAFEKTNSVFYIGTAGQEAIGHGDTITDLHLSEVSRYADPEKIVRGTFPAAEHGEITVESTGNGVGNWFHRQCVRAREGRGFKLFFFSWLDDPMYSLPFLSEEDSDYFVRHLDPDLEEVSLYARGVSLEQLQWRRERLEIDYELDLSSFNEAYPTEFDDCFQTKGFSFFRKIKFSAEGWTQESQNLHVLAHHPKPSHTYCIGADPAGGVGQNNSVAEVFCLETQEQVAEYASSFVEPHEFANVLADLGKRFNYAYVNVERNNHGLTTIARLVDIYPLHLLHRNTHGEQAGQEVLARLSHFGTQTGPANRGIMIGTARRLLGTDFTVHSPLLKSELTTFVEKEEGKIEADNGCLDDRVMAAVMALVVLERAGVVASSSSQIDLHDNEPDQFSFEHIFAQHVEGAPEPSILGTPARFH